MSSDNDQTRLGTAEGFDVSGAVIRADGEAFETMLTQVTQVADEVVFAVEGDRLTVEAVDPANVLLIEDVEVPLEESVEPFEIGINVGELKADLDSDMGFVADEVHLKIDLTEDEQTVTVPNYGEGFEYRAIEPSAIRATPDLDEDARAHEAIEMPGYAFRGTIGEVARESEGGVLIDPEDGRLVARNIDGDVVLSVECDATNGNAALFSAGLLERVAAGILPQTDVTLRVEEKALLVVETPTATYLVAPRIRGLD